MIASTFRRSMARISSNLERIITAKTYAGISYQTVLERRAPHVGFFFAVRPAGADGHYFQDRWIGQVREQCGCATWSVSGLRRRTQ